jgi:DNA polymerase-3 subunit alpha/error-prone DNA polymerase
MEASLTKWSCYNPLPSAQREFNLHKILRAIDTNVILSRLKPIIVKTSELMIPLELLT